MVEAARRMQELVDHLLALARAGRITGEREAVPVREVIEEARRGLESRLSARGVRIEVPGELPVVFGDRGRLVQVFQNVLDNAAKFLGDQPSPCVHIDSYAEADGWSVVVVRDNGIGIEARHLRQVFGLFEKLDPRGEGTGVGLALVARIVQAHGGRVWLESAGRGAGTAVCIALPPVPKPAVVGGVGLPR
jgi:signal transduction histidine kinase